MKTRQIKIEYKRQLALAKIPICPTRKMKRFNAVHSQHTIYTKHDARLTEAGKQRCIK